MIQFLVKPLVATGVLLISMNAAAQSAANFPEKAVRVIVASSPGGYLDIITRAISKELSTTWNQPFVIENRAGASGAIGAITVQKAEPDGYTWLGATEAHMVTNRFLMKNIGYDFARDFVGVSVLAKAEQVVVATASFPAKSLPEIVQMARRSPEKIVYGTYGVGSHPHLFFERFAALNKIEFIMVPYKGVAPTVQAMRAEEVKLSMMSIGTARPLLESGARILAVTSKERSRDYPNVPTTDELGYPGLQSAIYMLSVLPKGTPAAIVDKASTAVRTILRRPDFASQWVTGRGFQVVAGDSKSVSDLVEELVPRTAEMVRAAKIQPE